MTDIATLFSRDPLEMSDRDIDEIVEKFRSSRHLFNAGNMRAGSTKPKTEKQKEAIKFAEKLQGDLGDLGL